MEPDDIDDETLAFVLGALRGPDEERPTEILKFFKFDHLKDESLRSMSKHFAQLAAIVVLKAPNSAERTYALRQLLLAKDGAVRACLP